MTDLNVDRFVGMPTGNVALTDRVAGLPLPRDSHSDAPVLHYGPFLDSLAAYFKANGGQHLLNALNVLLDRPVALEEIRSTRLISEKHGALYHVARLRIELIHAVVSLAVNVALTEAQKAFLDTEFALLQELHERFALPHLPRPLLRGEALYQASPGDGRWMRLFVAQWFEEFCEFHLSQPTSSARRLRIRVWDQSKEGRFLSADEEQILYREMSLILTDTFDTQTLRQIYPWHHAAGDFVARLNSGTLEVKLITARGYRSLGDFPPSEGGLVIAALHFLLNMSLRLRLDRLDGTGELAWADRECLPGIVDGFVRSWKTKCVVDETLPSPEQLLDLMSRFTPDEWVSFGELVMDDGMVEQEEAGFLRGHLEGHVHDLAKVIRTRVG